jgi:hypothetical protein
MPVTCISIHILLKLHQNIVQISICLIYEHVIFPRMLIFPILLTVKNICDYSRICNSFHTHDLGYGRKSTTQGHHREPSLFITAVINYRSLTWKLKGKHGSQHLLACLEEILKLVQICK